MTLDPNQEIDLDDDQDAAAFLENLTVAAEDRKKPADTAEAPTGQEAPEAASEAPEETADGTEAPEAQELADDVKLKLTINGESREVTLADLKRLAESEGSLTRQTAEVTEARQHAQTVSEKAQTALKGMLERAEARFKPYAEMDFLRLSRTMDDASWEALRSMALEAQADVNYLKSELDQTHQAVQQERVASVQRAAQEAVKVLSGPADKGGIEGWSQPLYNDVMAYAIAQGVPKDLAYGVVDPAAIRMMHKAMLFDRGAKAVEAQIVKVKAAPVKVAKPGGGTGTASKASDAMSRLVRTGSDDDAADAFLASFRA